MQHQSPRDDVGRSVLRSPRARFQTLRSRSWYVLPSRFPSAMLLSMTRLANSSTVVVLAAKGSSPWPSQQPNTNVSKDPARNKEATMTGNLIDKAAALSLSLPTPLNDSQHRMLNHRRGLHRKHGSVVRVATAPNEVDISDSVALYHVSIKNDGLLKSPV